MASSHPDHQHILFFFQKSLRNLFWSSFLRQNGIGLVDIFTFVYLYKIGSTLSLFPVQGWNSFQQGIFTVIADVLILRIVELIVIMPLTQIAANLGLPKAAIIGNFLMALRYALLAFSGKYPYLIFSAAIIQGIEISVFGPAYDTMFTKRASISKVGRDVSAFTFVLKLSYSLLPAVAAALIVGFGFSLAFAGATILLLLSNVPLLAMRWKEQLTQPTLFGFGKWLKRDMDKRIGIALIGRYINDMGAELWPIYLVLLFGRIERVGIVMTIALLISLLLVYATGWFVDHSKKNTPFIIGGVLLSLFWFARVNIVLITAVLALEIAQRLVESFFYPSFDAFLYRYSKQQDTFPFHVYKESLTCIVSITAWTVLAIFCLTSVYAWSWMFIAAAVGIISSTMLYTVR